jgi:hypothetical protein
MISRLGMSNVATGYLAEVIDVGDNRVERVQSPINMRKVSTLDVDPTPEDLGD